MNPDLFIEQELQRYKYNESLSEEDLLKILKNKQLPDDFIQKVMNRAKNKNLSINIEDIYNFPDKYPNSPLFVKCIDCLEAENFDDSIGDTTKLIDIIDFDSRDKSFVDINNEIYISDVGEKHADLINKILGTNFRTRPQNSDLNDIKIGFGHIIGDTYFIEDDTYFTNMTAEEVMNDIKDYKKIYQYDRNDLTITRLAKGYKKMRKISRLRKVNEARMKKYAGFSDALSALTNGGISSFWKVMTDTSLQELGKDSVVNDLSNGAKNAIFGGIAGISSRINDLGQYISRLSPDQQEAVQESVDIFLEPILGPNAIEICTGTVAIAAAIAAILAKTGVIESSKFAEAQAGLDMLINKVKAKFA